MPRCARNNVDRSEYDFAFSRHDLPEVLHFVGPLKTEGAGKTGCALHPRSHAQCLQTKTRTSIQVQRRASGLPCATALRLIGGRPGDRLCCHHRLWRLSPSLTPAPGRRTLTKPYATDALGSRAIASAVICPSFAKMANVPLVGPDGGSHKVDLPDGSIEIFSRDAIDTMSREPWS